MSNIPHDEHLDSTIAILQEGFPFILNRSLRYRSDLFKIRLMGQQAICIHGEEAVKLFYEPDRFIRKGAIPKRIQKTLTGENAIHTLDDAVHRRRKEIFMSLMSPEGIQRLNDLTADQWRLYIDRWENQEQVLLFTQAQEIMCRAVCIWAGVPLQEDEAEKRARDLGLMVDAFGAVGPRHWRGKLARGRAERWIMQVIDRVRKDELAVGEGTAIYKMAFYQDLDGNLLDKKMAAIELLNIIRPTAAISWYITFAAMALHEYPQYRQQVQADEEGYHELFVQEVRRYYPFAPFLGARVRDDFEWKGHKFRKGTLVLLDVYGTNHDPRLWENPEEFNPERFRNWKENPFNFIPQGGGDHYQGHRCPGEWITIETTKVALHFLTQYMTYDVPEQDLSISLSRMPTIPKSRFVISSVRKKASVASGEEIYGSQAKGG